MMEMKRLLIEVNLDKEELYCVGEVRVISESKEKTLYIQRRIVKNDFTTRFDDVWKELGEDVKRMVLCQ